MEADRFFEADGLERFAVDPIEAVVFEGSPAKCVSEPAGFRLDFALLGIRARRRDAVLIARVVEAEEVSGTVRGLN